MFWKRGCGVLKPFRHVSRVYLDARDADGEQLWLGHAADSQNSAVQSGLNLGGGESSKRIARKCLTTNPITVYVPLCRDTQEYLERMTTLARECVDRLTDTSSLWFLMPERWADEIGLMLKGLLPRRNRIIWRETFGQYRETVFPSGHRHLFWHVKDPKTSPFYTDEIRVVRSRWSTVTNVLLAPGFRMMFGSCRVLSAPLTKASKGIRASFPKHF